MLEEAEFRTQELQDHLQALDSLLAATLSIDDFVDLEALKQPVVHPPFPRWDLESPIASPPEFPDPPMPVLEPVPEPKALFGKQKKWELAKAEAEHRHSAALAQWNGERARLASLRDANVRLHEQAERERLTALSQARTAYHAQSEARIAQAAKQHEEIDALVAGLAYGVPSAVDEYVTIVLANSVYPEGFDVEHDANFDASSGELVLRVSIPDPAAVPTDRAFKYVRASDEIVAVAQTQKESRERYASIVHQVALRSLHEVFEADRRNLIRSVSLEVGTLTQHPATGRDTFIRFVAVAADRDRFGEFNLGAVVPAATLELLGAAVAKQPYLLKGVDANGVRSYAGE
ncbi:hypothetical protein [Agrococcus jenensis]|uniref:Restriction system protein n=1 Tax=Agrococcus jenensis TaxID=46353 RepID=A0A3N2AR78_9MICO|nr:hypothetical protein [Agrococcus jenensis]ROR65550.1 restriction system protein [Agrococcus jenensis]